MIIHQHKLTVCIFRGGNTEAQRGGRNHPGFQGQQGVTLTNLFAFEQGSFPFLPQKERTKSVRTVFALIRNLWLFWHLVSNGGKSVQEIAYKEGRRTGRRNKKEVPLLELRESEGNAERSDATNTLLGQSPFLMLSYQTWRLVGSRCTRKVPSQLELQLQRRTLTLASEGWDLPQATRLGQLRFP